MVFVWFIDQQFYSAECLIYASVVSYTQNMFVLWARNFIRQNDAQGSTYPISQRSGADKIYCEANGF